MSVEWQREISETSFCDRIRDDRSFARPVVKVQSVAADARDGDAADLTRRFTGSTLRRQSGRLSSMEEHNEVDDISRGESFIG